MKIPARFDTCNHVQCFDLDAFLGLNQKRLAFNCPICKKSSFISHLIIDGLLSKLLANCPPNSVEVTISANGDHSYVTKDKKKPSSSRLLERTILIDDDDDEDEIEQIRASLDQSCQVVSDDTEIEEDEENILHYY